MIGHSQFWTTQYKALLFYYQITELAAFSGFSKEYPNLKGNYFFVWYAEGLTPEKHIICTETEPNEKKLKDIIEREHIYIINCIGLNNKKLEGSKVWREIALWNGNIILFCHSNKTVFRLELTNIIFTETSFNCEITIENTDKKLFKYPFCCSIDERPNEYEFKKIEEKIIASLNTEYEKYLKRQELERINQIERNEFFSRKVEMKKENAKQLTLF